MTHISKLAAMSKKIRLRLIFEGIIIGACAGVVTSLYRLALSNAEKLSKIIYAFAKTGVIAAAVVFIGLAAAALICGFIVKSEPMIKGSGIPQVEGKLAGLFDYSWWKVMIKKFIAGTISICAGLSLGREGPSIQLGACAGEGLSKLFKRIRFEEKYMITCGASAGLASAFNAPFAGVLFALEEVHKSFSPNVLLSAMAAAVTGDLVSKAFFGMNPVFNIASSAPVPVRFYIVVAAMGAALGIFGAAYNKTLIASQKLYGRIRIPEVTKQIIPFLCAGVLGIVLPEVLGGGHGIIDGIIHNEYALMYMLLLLLVKFVFSMISFGSGAAGGIFFPLLVLGALFGGITGTLSVDYLGMPSRYITTFMLLGMVGMFTGIVRAPITGIVLIVEMSGSLSQLLSLALVAAMAYIAADSLGVKPVYELLLERISGSKRTENKEKLIIEVNATESCKADGVSFDKLIMPKSCVLMGVVRQGEELMPYEAECVKSGDIMVVMCESDKEDFVRREFEKIFEGGYND